MIDFRYLHMREDKIKQAFGVPYNNPNNPYPKNTLDTFSIYVNPSNWSITGIRDNESDKFYKITQDDLTRFVAMLNIREREFTQTVSGIDSMTKSFIDRETRLYNALNDYENEIRELKERINDLEKKLNGDVNVV